jgi:hypothetical protein
MAEKPEALRLAEWLDSAYEGEALDAAAELRRLVAENERLHQINQSHEMKLSVRGYEIQIEDLRLAHAELRERNAELLAAMISFTNSAYIKKHHPKRYAAAMAAIAKTEAEK